MLTLSLYMSLFLTPSLYLSLSLSLSLSLLSAHRSLFFLLSVSHDCTFQSVYFLFASLIILFLSKDNSSVNAEKNDSVSEKALDRQSEVLKMDFNTYVKETTSALTNASQSGTAFECIFKPLGHSSGQLSWKKIPAQSIKVSFFHELIYPVNLLCS